MTCCSRSATCASLDDRGVQTVNGFTAEVRGGEVFGIAGVEGNGQRELVEAITGMRRKVGGQVHILGHDATKMSPRQITELGTAHIPEDRGKHGLVGGVHDRRQRRPQPLRQGPVRPAGRPQPGAVDAEARRIVAEFDVRTPGIDVAVGTLSGGNQQKVIVARELSGDLKVLFVAQPTRGLDVGSIEFIHRQIIALRDGAPPCSSCRPSSTRSCRCRTASACCTAGASSASSTGRRRRGRGWAT